MLSVPPKEADELGELRETQPAVDALIRYLDRWTRKQDFQAWWMTAISVLLGWIIGQVSLQSIFQHLIH